ncbi:MAG: HD domain-containing protein [archaeon]
MDKKEFIKDFKSGNQIHSKFAVKFKKPLREYAKGYRFDVRGSDKTGEITITYWGDRNRDAAQKLYDSFNTNDVIELSGIVGEYQDNLQISVNPEQHIFKKCTRAEYNIEDFIPHTENDIDQMFAQLSQYIISITDPHMKSLLDSFFHDSKFIDQFRSSPASMHIHSNYIGGLLEHTLAVTKIVDALAAVHIRLDRNLAITGAILHDIGKVKEFTTTTSIDISEEGMLRGHVVIGEQMVLDRIKKIEGFPQILKLKIAHMILSHHKELEWGAPKKPQFAEAVAIHYADDADAKLFQFITLKQNANTEDPWIWDRRVGHVFLK